MKKPSKKELMYIGGITAIGIVIFLLYKKSTTSYIDTGSGQQPDTAYMTYNIPPINSSGFAQPDFGNINIPGINYNAGGCNACYSNNYYGSSIGTATALGDTGANNINDILSTLPNYQIATIDNTINSGNIYDYNQHLISQLPILALGTPDTIVNEPAQQTGKVTNLPILAL